MNIFDAFTAVFMLGLPMVVLSWVIFSWIFLSGEIDREEKRDAITKRVKKMKTLPGLKGSRGKKYMYEKWAWFGSGFYGLAGFWTLIVIEAGELFGFVTNLGSFEGIGDAGLISFIIDFFIDQLGNLIQAFLWWSYWPADSILVWLAVAYGGYWIGVELARHTQFSSLDKTSRDLVKELRARFPKGPRP